MGPAGRTLRRQLASLPIAVILLGPGQVITSANPAAEQFLGQSARRLINRSLFDMLHFHPSRLIEQIIAGEQQISARQIDIHVVGVGTRRRVDLTIAPVVDEPGWQVLTLHDSASADALGEALVGRADGVLRAPEILAHEIKNPLAGIRGAAQLLARKVSPGDRALTTLIADEVDRIAKLIDQMQTLSQRTPSPSGLATSTRRSAMPARSWRPPVVMPIATGRASRRSSIPRCRWCWAA